MRAAPALIALIAVAAASAAPAFAVAPTPIPRAVCVAQASAGPVAVFDVRITGDRQVSMPLGGRNRVLGGHVLGAHPTSFPPGLTREALRVRFTSGRATWRLGRRVAGLARDGPRCRRPVVVARPTIAGVPEDGRTLAASHGRWHRAIGAFRYRWQRRTAAGWTYAGEPNAVVLPLSSRDAGSFLRVLVRARGRGGWSAPAASAPVGPVQPRPAGGDDGPVAQQTLSPPVPRNVFSPSSFWNATIPANIAFATDAVAVGTAPDGTTITAPVNPTVAQQLADYAELADGSSNTRVYYRAYTAPLTTVPADTPLQPVRLCRTYPSDCVPSWATSLDRTLRGVAADGAYLGGGVPVPPGFTPPADGDKQAVFYQPGYVAPNGRQGRLYELWGLGLNPDFDPSMPVSPSNARWMARWGGRMVGVTGQGVGYWYDCWWSGCGYQADTRADPNAWGRPDSQAQDHSWGATATSLPLLGDEVSLDECRSGVIQHAIGLQVPVARRQPWWPAQRTDGLSWTTTLIEGMRLTFPPESTKPPGLTRLGGSLWDATKRYGLVIDDTTGDTITIRVEPGCEATPWWGGVDLSAQLANFPWSELRVIARGSASNPNPTQGG
jgi:hypothetical protein